MLASVRDLNKPIKIILFFSWIKEYIYYLRLKFGKGSLVVVGDNARNKFNIKLFEYCKILMFGTLQLQKF